MILAFAIGVAWMGLSTWLIVRKMRTFDEPTLHWIGSQYPAAIVIALTITVFLMPIFAVEKLPKRKR